jgi:hypothetical protein
MTTPPDKRWRPLIDAMNNALQDTYASGRPAAHLEDAWENLQTALWALVDGPQSAIAARMQIPLRVRPLLVQGMLAYDERGPLILINSEENDPMEQVRTLWHEVLHLIGMTDEFLCDEYAMRLADAAPDILRRLAHNINVPDSEPRSHEQPRERGEPLTQHVIDGNQGWLRATLPAKYHDFYDKLVAMAGNSILYAEEIQRLRDGPRSSIGRSRAERCLDYLKQFKDDQKGGRTLDWGWISMLEQSLRDEVNEAPSAIAPRKESDAE